ncbi:putative cytochrome P450 6a17 [Lycorma delicatula]|uniref:putative cytochrome P450 6a17 n=1 Tax=Lycorma delicatula TaxID=130591 RepID=UPI003F5125A2
MSHSIGNYWFEILLGIIVFIVIFYRFWTKNYNYWKDRNVPCLEPVFPFGNGKDFILSTRFVGLVFKDLYFKLKGLKFGGYILMRRPGLLLRDPEIIKQIMTKDFNYFTDRGNTVDEENDPLTAHLFNLCGEKWRKLRIKLTPTFTSGKMKTMFYLIKTCSKQLERNLNDYAEREDVIELKYFTARFTIDTIGSCAFGLDIDSLNNPDNEFYRISKGIFQLSMKSNIRNALNSIIPGITKTLGIKFTPKDREEFFFRIVRESVDYRERNKVTRNDFLDLLIQLKNGHQITDDNEKKSNHQVTEICNNLRRNNEDSGQLLDQNSTNDLILTNELMTAQCFVFFIAGYETSSTTLSFCLYELALNEEIQTKLQEEIDKVLAKHNGDISYESLKEMTYMDRVVEETLRKYPPVSILTRECVADYKLKESNLEIKRGLRITIPLYGIHYDPEYYPDPEHFNPDNFTEEAKKSRHHYTWLPFGEGPRNCIGMRFGILQVKTGLASLLSNYSFHRTPETQVPIVLSTKSFVTTAKDGIKLKISKRQK